MSSYLETTFKFNRHKFMVGEDYRTLENTDTKQQSI